MQIYAYLIQFNSVPYKQHSLPCYKAGAWKTIPLSNNPRKKRPKNASVHTRTSVICMQWPDLGCQWPWKMLRHFSLSHYISVLMGEFNFPAKEALEGKWPAEYLKYPNISAIVCGLPFYFWLFHSGLYARADYLQKYSWKLRFYEILILSLILFTV